MKSRKKQPKSFLARLWYFIWKDDSLLSWIVNILIAFLLVKFLIYPGLGLILQTDYPVVAVVSSSMEHEGKKFDSWWSINGAWYLDNDFALEQFQSSTFKNGFNKGDIIILHGIEPKDIKIGDIIVYSSSAHKYPIIHRVIACEENENGLVFTLKGDNNPSEDPLPVYEGQILGKAQFKIPYLGYMKIWANDIFMMLGGG